MKVAILTFHRSRNCGAMLQAYATCRTLRKMGHEVAFPDCSGKRYSDWEPLTRKGLSGWKAVSFFFHQVALNLLSIGFNREAPALYEAFADRWFPRSELKPQEFVGKFDAAVIGSDQVWSPRLTGKRWSIYTGKRVPDGVRLVSYAASCGDTIPKDRRFRALRDALRRFSGVSVREQVLHDKLAESWGIPSTIVVDPSLLLSAEDYAPAISTDLVPNEPYILVFYVRSPEFPCKVARYLAKRMKMKVILAPGRLRSRLGKPKGALLGLSPDRFLGLFANAQAVVASSFHATAFSLIFRKPFVALQNGKATMGSRAESLLQSLGLADRFILRKPDLEGIVARLSEPIPPSAYEKLDELKGRSLDWLRNSLEA